MEAEQSVSSFFAKTNLDKLSRILGYNKATLLYFENSMRKNQAPHLFEEKALCETRQ